jgi:dihydroorotate dehydrogenase electron transfer subunit
VTVQQFEATVLSRAALRPTLTHLVLNTSALAAVPSPGQFFMARCEGVYLRRALFPCGIETEHVSVLAPLGRDLGQSWVAARQIGETVDLIGPLGKGFSLEGTHGRLLLVGLGSDLAPLLALAGVALKQEWMVVLLASFERADLAVPTALLPSEVEYQVTLGASASTELDLVLRDTLPWADMVCTDGAIDHVARLEAAIGDVRLGVRPGLAQVLVRVPMACGMGACGACAVETRRGIRHACLDGPVFDLADFAR